MLLEKPNIIIKKEHIHIRFYNFIVNNPKMGFGIIFLSVLFQRLPVISYLYTRKMDNTLDDMERSLLSKKTFFLIFSFNLNCLTTIFKAFSFNPLNILLDLIFIIKNIYNKERINGNKLYEYLADSVFSIFVFFAIILPVYCVLTNKKHQFIYIYFFFIVVGSIISLIVFFSGLPFVFYSEKFRDYLNRFSCPCPFHEKKNK